ncbi:DoxX family protein [Nocardioides sp. CF8]|nr:DoxX family protein [Nocardioides sp. CF8]
MFVVGGVNALKNAGALAGKAQPVTDRFVPMVQRVVPQAPIPTDATTLVRLNAGVQILAGAALATGHAPRLASTALAATLVPTTLAGHRFWEETDPALKGNQKVHFFKNVSMFGGLLIAGADTDGKPGVAWRARHAATDVKREARRLAKDARREAKLAKAQIG